MAIPSIKDLAAGMRRRAGAVRRALHDDFRYVSESFAQEGEDLILRRIFEGQRAGFYVDVGAHHPMRFSNTYGFYRTGWRGINIDANPGSMASFIEARPRDINLQIPISDRAEVLRYFVFDEPALNTFSEALAEERGKTTKYRVVGTVELAAQPLAAVLAAYVPAGQAIDFLTVDVEGWDLRVLRSNDWKRFSPRVVVAEALCRSLEDVQDTELVAFLRGQGYGLFAKTFNSVFLIRA